MSEDEILRLAGEHHVRLLPMLDPKAALVPFAKALRTINRAALVTELDKAFDYKERSLDGWVVDQIIAALRELGVEIKD